MYMVMLLDHNNKTLGVHSTHDAQDAQDAYDNGADLMIHEHTVYPNAPIITSVVMYSVDAIMRKEGPSQ